MVAAATWDWHIPSGIMKFAVERARSRSMSTMPHGIKADEVRLDAARTLRKCRTRGNLRRDVELTTPSSDEDVINPILYRARDHPRAQSRDQL